MLNKKEKDFIGRKIVNHINDLKIETNKIQFNTLRTLSKLKSDEQLEALLKNNNDDFKKFCRNVGNIIKLKNMTPYGYSAIVIYIAEKLGKSYKVSVAYSYPKSKEDFDDKKAKYNKAELQVITTTVVEVDGVSYEYCLGEYSENDTDKFEHFEIEELEMEKYFKQVEEDTKKLPIKEGEKK